MLRSKTFSDPTILYFIKYKNPVYETLTLDLKVLSIFSLFLSTCCQIGISRSQTTHNQKIKVHFRLIFYNSIKITVEYTNLTKLGFNNQFSYLVHFSFVHAEAGPKPQYIHW